MNNKKIEEKDWKIGVFQEQINILKENKELQGTITGNEVEDLKRSIKLIEWGMKQKDADIEKLKGMLEQSMKSSAEWMQGYNRLEDDLKKAWAKLIQKDAEIEKLIDEFCFSADKYDNIEIKRELKQKLGVGE
ncbi:hypothetical protein LCGC14_3128680 [marine sediment metagenome]|uniref:Uncharacterized protein n=1 Tax=marine sediment metagenome TaxID=412755 RepID=A0A0F8WP49_9ZZZZ